MIDIAEYEALKSKVDRIKEELSEGAGEKKLLLKQLKKKFGVDTIEDARIKLRKLAKEHKKLEKQFNERMAKFDQEWFDVLAERENTTVESKVRRGQSTGRKRKQGSRRGSEDE